VVTCPGDITVSNDLGDCGAIVNFEATATDNCSTFGGGTAPSSPMVISGVFDGPITGGIPKVVEFYVISDIADLSLYGFGAANNGGGTDGQEYTFSGSANAGDRIYISTEITAFTSYFGFAPTDTDSDAGINGDDAIELFYNGSVIDTFGALTGGNSGWNYTDGWAYRSNNTGPDGSTFVPGNWTFSGANATDNCTTNASCSSVFPIGTYTNSSGGGSGGTISYSHQPGDFFPVGTTEVTVTATDAAG
ncbi:HYR domain-containing protein, partial [Formosa maritima]